MRISIVVHKILTHGQVIRTLNVWIHTVQYNEQLQGGVMIKKEPVGQYEIINYIEMDNYYYNRFVERISDILF